jgi:hypothetical protein
MWTMRIERKGPDEQQAEGALPLLQPACLQDKNTEPPELASEARNGAHTRAMRSIVSWVN